MSDLTDSFNLADVYCMKSCDDYNYTIVMFGYESKRVPMEHLDLAQTWHKWRKDKGMTGVESFFEQHEEDIEYVKAEIDFTCDKCASEIKIGAPMVRIRKEFCHRDCHLKEVAEYNRKAHKPRPGGADWVAPFKYTIYTVISPK